MCPKEYHVWSALSVMGIAIELRLWFSHNYFKVLTPMYVTLVGRQGSKKSTAMKEGKKLLLEVFPDIPLGSSVMTRERIVERMSGTDWRRFMGAGNDIEYTPVAFFINELKNFLSFNAAGMIEFLTDIYGEDDCFTSDTIKRGSEPIPKPCVNILACETPKWLVDKLRLGIITGGFSRRMLFVYVLKKPKPITFPIVTDESKAAKDWCAAHLQKVRGYTGEFTWLDEAREWFDKWNQETVYHGNDEILEGLYDTKDILSIQLAMRLAMCYENPEPKFTLEIIQKATSLLMSLEKTLPKLTIAAGRNELAVPQQALLDLLAERDDGWMSEKEFHAMADKHLNPMEYRMVLQLFRDLGEIHIAPVSFNGVKKTMVMTAAKFQELTESGQLSKA